MKYKDLLAKISILALLALSIVLPVNDDGKNMDSPTFILFPLAIAATIAYLIYKDGLTKSKPIIVGWLVTLGLLLLLKFDDGSGRIFEGFEALSYFFYAISLVVSMYFVTVYSFFSKKY